jgi:hypothetical protein
LNARAITVHNELLDLDQEWRFEYDASQSPARLIGVTVQNARVTAYEYDAAKPAYNQEPAGHGDLAE